MLLESYPPTHPIFVALVINEFKLLQALQLYQMPMVAQSPQASPGRLSAFNESGTLYLVEFIRMHKVDMFTFKRFYQWVRKEVGELVKKDYAIESFTAGSPM